eukprot:sb/3477945/
MTYLILPILEDFLCSISIFLSRLLRLNLVDLNLEEFVFKISVNLELISLADVLPLGNRPTQVNNQSDSLFMSRDWSSANQGPVSLFGRFLVRIDHSPTPVDSAI